jgi:transcriptional regulator with XRE-family HTH domain
LDDIADSSTATLGARLRAAREAAGLSLADVSARTKVRPGLLTAFEADDHAKLPALTYALGFVKAYARTVGLDPDEAAETYRRESGAQAPIPIEGSLQPLDERRLPSSRTVVAASAAVVLGVGMLWAWGAGWFNAPVPAPPTAVTVPPARAAAAAQPGAAQTASAPLPANAPVVITAADDVWMRIYDRQSGRAVFNGTLPKGQVFTLPPPEAGWLVRTGRAGALAITVGGRPIPPLGGPAETIRNVPLGPEALLARTQQAAPVNPPSTSP